MRSQRVLLLLAALLVGALLLLVATWSGDDGLSIDAQRANSRAEHAAAPGLEAHPNATRGGESRESAASAERSVAEVSEAPQPASARGIEVLARKQGTSAALASVDITWWPRPPNDQFEAQFERWLAANEVEERIAANARHFTTDAEGRVTVPECEHGFVVVGSRGDLWGWTRTDPLDEAPIVIALVRDVALRARVVDTAGHAVIGARVALRTRWEKWHQDLELALTAAPDGIATLRHAGVLMARFAEENTLIEVALAELVEPSQVTRVWRDKPPTEPFEFVLGATGSCEVLCVDLEGAPLSDPCIVYLRSIARDEDRNALLGEDPNLYSGECVPRTTDGRALFRHVELNREWIATVRRAAAEVHSSAIGFGPTAPGQTATLTVKVGESVALLRGRLFLSDSSVASNVQIGARVEVRESRQSVQHTWSMTTKADGRFEVEVAPHSADEEPLDFVVYVIGPQGQDADVARVELPRTLSKGAHELGDLVVRPSPVLASGTVVDASGKAVEGAWVTGSVSVTYGDLSGEMWWESLYGNRARTDAAGAFALRSERHGERVSLSAAKDKLRGGPQVVASGARDVVLTLAATGTLEGVVLLDASISRASIAVQIVPREPQSDDSFAQDGAPPSPNEDGGFAITGLRPGLYDVHIMDRTNWEPLHVVEGVSVTGGAPTRDPRLDPLDLRARYTALVLSVFDESSAPVPHGNVVATSPGAIDGRYYVFDDGKCVIVHAGGALDLEISATGFLPQRVLGVVANQRVVLRQGAVLHFQLAAGLRVPDEPYLLFVQLTALDGEWNSSAWNTGPPVFGSDGHAEQRVSMAGRARLSLMLAINDDDVGWGSLYLGESATREIVISDRAAEQTFEVAFDPADLAKAMKLLHDD